MTGFLSKIFSGKKKSEEASGPIELVEDLVDALIEKGQFQLSAEVDQQENSITVEFFGDDEGLLKGKDGQLLDAIQLFLKRSLQHHLPEDRLNLGVDCGGFREEANQSLISLAEKLKGIAVDKGKPVYFRALPPRDRKVIHQYLAEDERVKSRSVGEGLYKKIKISPVDGQVNGNREASAESFGAH